MRLFRSLPIRVVLPLFGLGLMVHANVSQARVSCDATKCTWSSPWRSDIAIRLTVGTDQDGTLRWVVSPQHNLAEWQTGTMSKNVRWVFFGSDANDIMVEVPRAQPTITHGVFVLSHPNGLTPGIEFWSYDGNDVVLGGNFTKVIGGDPATITSGVPQGTGTKIYIIHPNAPGETGSGIRTARGAQGTSIVIAGPSLHPTATAFNRIELRGGESSDIICNITGNPIEAIRAGFDDFGDPRDVIFGPARIISGSPTVSSDAGSLCASIWVSTMRSVYAPVQ